MKHFFSIAFAFLILSCFSQNTQTQDQDYENGVVLFGLSEDYNVSHIPFTEDFSVNPELLPELSDIFEKYGLVLLSRPYLAFESPILERVIKMHFYKTTEIDNLIEELENRKSIIKYAEKSPIMKKLSIPNDPFYNVIDGVNLKWHLDMILAEGAWMIQQGNPAVKVAIVDNFVWGDHPDLNISSSNLYNAYNSTIGNASPPNSQNSSMTAYNNSHGTHTAGLVGAINNNDIGIASIGGGVTLMGVRIGDNSGNLTSPSNGITWAIQNGAKVINMSFGHKGYSQSEASVYQAYANQGVVLVAAAGNEGDDENYISYPAGYSGVISVASVNGDEQLSYFSQHDSGRADIAAPGGFIASKAVLPNILSTTFCFPNYLDNYSFLDGLNYDGMQGTSMSSPICAGLCGLLLSFDPTLTSTQLKTILQQTASPLSPSSTTTINGQGYINAFAALMSLVDSSIFKISKDTIDVSCLKNIDSVLVVSHYDYVVNNTPSWINIIANPYYGKSKRLLLQIDENFSISPRSCELEIYCPTLDSTLIVTISQEAYPHTLLINKDTVRISSTQGSTSVLFLKTNVHWAINEAIPSWMSVDNTSGDTSMSLIFTVTDDNLTGINQYATFTISGDGVPDVTFTVLHSPEELYFYTDKSLINLGSGRNTRDTIWITSNTDWEIVGYDSNLVSIVPKSGLGDGFIVVSSKSANGNYFPVFTTIGVCPNGSSLSEMLISQKGADHLQLDQSTYTLGAEQGSTISIPVNSNVSWFVTPSNDIWLSPNVTEGSDSMNVIITALETNNTGATRSTTYSFRATFAIKRVTINQEAVEGTGISDIKKGSLNIYPNPTKGLITVSAGEQPIKQIQLFAVTGNMLQNILLNKTTTTIDISNLSSGIYFMKIILNDNSVLTRKITKQ